jgi:hypothetical protein
MVTALVVADGEPPSRAFATLDERQPEAAEGERPAHHPYLIRDATHCRR